MICFQRQTPPPGGEWAEVPGCIGGREFQAKSDFCILPQVESALAQPTWAPTWSPTFAPTESVTEMGTAGPTQMATSPDYWLLPELQFLGDNVGAVGSPLGLCQGMRKQCNVFRLKLSIELILFYPSR